VFGVQITTNNRHKINFPGWESFSSATGCRILVFAVPLREWATFPLQSFDGGPPDAAQVAPCDQYVITWVPVTEGELNNLSMNSLRNLCKAYDIDTSEPSEPSNPRQDLTKKLMEAEVPSADWGMLENVLQQACTPPQSPIASATTQPTTEPGPTVAAVDDAARQNPSPARRFSKEEVESWKVNYLKETARKYNVSTTGEDGKQLKKPDLQKRIISQLGTDP
jgi:hypothetical protein